jgi:multiple sugar transport system substrate-binding protein
MERIVKKSNALLFIWVIGMLLAVPPVLFAKGGRDTAAASGEKVTIRCWSFFSGDDDKIFNAMIARFNRTHPDIRVISEEKPDTDYDFILSSAIATGTAPGAAGLAVENTASAFTPWTLTRLFISLLKQQGADVLTGDNHAGFNNTAGEKALSAIIDMNQVAKVVPPDLTYEASVNAFRQGKAGIHINGVWASGVFEKQQDLKFAATPLPPLFGRSAAWAASHTLAVLVQQNADPRTVEAAAAFILWMTEHGELWAKTGCVPVRESVTRKDEFLSLPYRAAYLEAAGSAVMPPHTPAWDEIYDSISDSLGNVLIVNKRVKTILTEMEQEVNEIIAEY